jgi:Entner-Doudoroff aldolase
VNEIDGPGPVTSAIDAGGVVAIIRGAFLDDIDVIVRGLIEGGVRAIEVSLTSPRALDQIERAVVVAGAAAVVGAGTVMTVAEVEQAAKRGASFIISPTVDEAVIKSALDLELTPVPGAATPTEIIRAVRLGATAVKVFPAETLGPEFVRAVLAPFPALQLIPTGGVTLPRAEMFRAAGAWAVGVGSPLVSAPLESSTLVSRAAAFVRAMRPPKG